VKHQIAGILVLLATVLGAPAFAVADSRAVPLAERTACPRQGGEALAFVGKTVAKNQPIFDHLALLCVAEVLKAQEKELKTVTKRVEALEARRAGANGQ
jgi:hypothetical protein